MAISYMSFRRSMLLAVSTLLSLAACNAGAQNPPSAAPSVSKSSKKTSRSQPPNDFHEDWSSITLESSKLKPIAPVVGERDDAPNSKFTRELVQLDWRPLDPLDLYVVLPKGVKKPPVILYLYTFPSDTDRFRSDRWCAGVTSDGYAAVGFVSALTGHRTQYRSLSMSFTGDLQEALVTTVHDVQMILNYLTERGDLDMDRVGMYGQGSGGTVAILASAADARLKAVDVLSPWADWPQFFAKAKIVPDEERTKDLSPENLAKLAPLDPVQWFPKVKARGVRIQNLRDDRNMLTESQERLENAAPAIAEINQFGNSRALFPSAAGGRLFDWLRAQLQTDAKPQVAADKSQRVHFYPAEGGSLESLNPSKP